MSFLYMSFSASCIVLFTVILRGLFKRFLPIELFCGLWWLAMIRALVPFSISSNYSIYNMKIALEGGLRQILDITLSEREQTEWIISIGLIGLYGTYNFYFSIFCKIFFKNAQIL